MKKNFNKIASLVLAAAMVAATPGMVFAHTITVENSANDTATHTYAAYQIFKGDLSDGKLSNVVWGSGIDQAKLGTAAKDIASALSISEADAVDAVKVSEALSGKADDSDVAQNFADAISEALGTTTSGTPKSNTIEGLDDGYYFVEDTTELSTVQSAKTRFILQVVGGNLTVKAKANVPTSMKKVDENNNDVKDQVDSRISDVTLTDKYNDVADYSIGDTIPYELVGTLPDNYDKCETYTYEFTDIAGLVKGASNGEGLGNKFLSHIREVDAIVEVVRCFENGDIIHVEGSVDPIRDIEIINVELIISDLNRRFDMPLMLFCFVGKDLVLGF